MDYSYLGFNVRVGSYPIAVLSESCGQALIKGVKSPPLSIKSIIVN